MTTIDPEEAREFAVYVVRKLREAGFEACWAGGCVRDQLLGLRPKDYDVATDATPDQTCKVFGFRRTLAIGEAFGVIVVLGPRTAGQIEVATFRADAQYSDGRHPDSVTFSSAEEDARRRDFTINGLFFDPIQQRAIDYVGGQADLERGVVRAIGNPLERIAEDKLRMLRAVRMAATFDFELDPQTLEAVQQQSHQITIVSAERIAGELRRMLPHANRRRAVELLRESRLLPIILPELQGITSDDDSQTDDAPWQRTLRVLDHLRDPTFSMTLAALVRESIHVEGHHVPEVQQICQRLKLTNAERRESELLLMHERSVRSAARVPWPRLQRILIQQYAANLLSYCRAVAKATGEDTAEIDYCRQKLSLPREELDPPPLINGNDLQDIGLPRGPVYKRVLDAVRDAQLEKRVGSKEEALELAKQLFSQGSP